MAKYKLIHQQELPEYNGVARFYRHLASGCEVFHLYNNNPENLFGFCFVTPPPDSTGVSHILEHTVLCGSRHFPLADPFLHLLKGSVHSFLNAITFPDRTIYPAASPLAKDLFNIMRVYGDAVFAPLLREQMFEQEGHRLLVDDENNLSIGGVVYNEMRGISVTHEYVESEWSIRGLLPDTPYQYASGGDPATIPALTYQQFLAFYRQHYHPTVARIFLYGNIPTQRYLKFLHRTFLTRAKATPSSSSSIIAQKRWERPRSLTRSYPQGGQQAGKNQSSLSLCWLLPEVRNSFDILCAEALSALLIDTPATPLYKAITESQLGEDVSSNSGAECELKELVFVVGVRGSAPEREKQFETLVLTTLKKIVKEGIDPKMAESVLVQLDISQREIRSLEGLRLLRRALPGWIYRGNPHSTLSAVEAMTTLRIRLAQDERFFESRIQKWLIDNPHRLSLVVKPDPQQAEQEQQKYCEALDARRAQMSTQVLNELKKRAQAHAQAVTQTDRPEDIARIPHLKVRDMPRRPRQLHWHTQELSRPKRFAPLVISTLDRHTNGITYCYLTFDIRGISTSYLCYLPILCTLMTEGGLKDMDYDTLSRDIARVGSIGATVRFEHSVNDPRQLSTRLVIRLKALDSTVARGFKLLEKILTGINFEQSDRLAQLIRERINELRASLIPAAHRFASSAAIAPLSYSGWIQEQWRGISQLSFLLETRPPQEFIAKLQELYCMIVCGGVREAVFCGEKIDAEFPSRTVQQLNQQLAQQFGTVADAYGQDTREANSARHHAYIIPSGGNYVAWALPATPFSATTVKNVIAETVLSRLLSTSVLWEEIRMKGGAYGAGANYASNEGVICLFSYRDPHVQETYDSFHAILKQAAAQPFPQHEVDRAIVTMSGKECESLTPAEEAYQVLDRMLSGMSNELRTQLHQALLKSQAADLQAAAHRLVQASGKAVFSVVGEEPTIQAAQSHWPQLKENVDRLPL